MLKQRISSGLSILITGLGLCLPPQIASAQKFEYNFMMSGDCGLLEYAPPPNTKFKDNKRSRPVKPPKDKQRKKYGLKSAEAALTAGYNYVIMAPLRTRYGYDVKDVVVGGGFSAAEKVERSYNHRTEIVQECTAIDDVAALNLIWSNSLPSKIVSRDDSAFEILDLREFIRSIDSGNTLVSRPRTPKISEAHYKNIGDRERIAAQIPVMTAARACLSNLAPTSLQVFKRDPQLRDRTAEKQCLETHRASAEAVKWADFPLSISETKNTIATKGYTLNRPRSSGSISNGQGQTVDTNIWGDGWFDLSANLNSPSGIFFFHDHANTILVGSNTLDEATAIDYAVFLSAGKVLDTQNSGIALRDKTSEYREKFENRKNYLLKKQQEAVEDGQRSNQRKTDSANRSIENKQEDIRRVEDRIRELREENDEATIAQMKAAVAAFPGAPFDEDALRKQLQTARNLSIQSREGKLAKLRTELAALEGKKSVTSTTTSSPTENTNLLPSESRSLRRLEKAIYRAFETNRTVFVLEGDTRLSTSKCYDYYLLCADKLQAYNALGPRVGKAGFTPLAAPSGYKPYENN